MSRNTEYGWGIQTKLSLASGLLVLISLAIFGWLTYSKTRDALELQMGERLASHAKITAAALLYYLPSRATTPGGEASKIYRGRLAAAKDAASLGEEATINLENVILIGPDYIVWADANGELPVGEPHWIASTYWEEMAIAWKGKVAVSPRYTDQDGTPYQSAYAPAKTQDGKVIAVVSVEASAEFLQKTIRSLGYALLLSAIVITAAAALVGMLIARSIVIPIKELVRASQQIAGGALDTEVFIESRDEIGFFARTFNQMTRNLRNLYEEVEERGKQIAELSASVAHEVRSPISAIQGFTELLEEDLDDDDPGHEYIADIKSEIRILNAKVTDFMNFARPMEIDSLPLDITEVLESALMSMDKEATDNNVGIVTNFGSALPVVRGDFDRLRGLIINLIRNAIQAMDGDGGLIVGAKLADRDKQNPDADVEFIEIRVEDTGCGMDPGALEHAFEPFFTTKGSGTGLGLAIVKKIVDVHKGKIELESEVGRGTTVKVFLPTEQN
ncbi:ATP-binding protein [Candidatus Poribacteria bacterium]